MLFLTLALLSRRLPLSYAVLFNFSNRFVTKSPLRENALIVIPVVHPSRPQAVRLAPAVAGHASVAYFGMRECATLAGAVGTSIGGSGRKKVPVGAKVQRKRFLVGEGGGASSDFFATAATNRCGGHTHFDCQRCFQQNPP